ncbi:MAG: hypothetical protein KF821_07185 [Anaerolineales bacterium]|jgi:hypothetical protein|nr:hypothetical protein [Anaerolineales bacterium]UYN91619.1 MAG: hypothetical protein KIT70_09685 [Anaerolineales bacterium]
MAAQKKNKTQPSKLDKAAVQRLLDLARILKEVASTEDIERIKRSLATFQNRESPVS